VRRGEVWWVAARSSGPGRKRRPWLIVSDDLFNANPGYDKVMAVHLTSVRRPGGPYPWEVDLPKGAANLDRHSVIKCGEVQTRAKDQLESLVGTLPRELMARVDRALAIALALPYPRGEG